MLKNAYFTESSGFRELETLPNIDINIKTGNSLLSEFDLAEGAIERGDVRFSGVAEYRRLVASYRAARGAKSKKEFAAAMIMRIMPASSEGARSA